MMNTHVNAYRAQHILRHTSNCRYFANFFTDNYNEIGKYYPELLRLRQLAKVVFMGARVQVSVKSILKRADFLQCYYKGACEAFVKNMKRVQDFEAKTKQKYINEYESKKAHNKEHGFDTSDLTRDQERRMKELEQNVLDSVTKSVN
jgi:hypothetical protein